MILPSLNPFPAPSISSLRIKCFIRGTETHPVVGWSYNTARPQTVPDENGKVTCFDRILHGAHSASPESVARRQACKAKVDKAFLSVDGFVKSSTVVIYNFFRTFYIDICRYASIFVVLLSDNKSVYAIPQSIEFSSCGRAGHRQPRYAVLEERTCGSD